MAFASSLISTSAPLDLTEASDRPNVKFISRRGRLFGWTEAEPLPALTPEQEAKFHQEDKELTLRNARLGTWTVITLVPLCILLDYAAYPEYLLSFSLLRIICSLTCLPILWILKHPWAERNYRIFPVILPIIPAFFISLMIYLSGEAHSSHYAGLTLCIVGTSFIFHWTFKEIGITLTLVLAMYFAATLPNLGRMPSTHAAGVFVNNTMFILLNCAILYVSSRQHCAIRIKEFLGRWVVEEQHQELASQNTELTIAFQRLRDTEAQLDHSDRLASIGRLSAGIIHEINNPLNFVKSALYVLNKKTRSMPPELAESVSNITRDVGEGVDRVVAIVSDLRTFAHPDKRSLHPVNVDSVLSKADRFLARDISDNHIHLSIQSEPGLQILADDREVLQVLINLLQNSIDALHQREHPTIQIATRYDGTNVFLSVTDNGTGISQEQASKIFDPFYTTKEVGKGMGLGLSICYRMMQQMEGDIEVESLPGEYTRFTLVFHATATQFHATSSPS